MAWICFCNFCLELQGCMQRSWTNAEYAILLQWIHIVTYITSYITRETSLLWESSRNLPNISLPGFQLLHMPAETTATVSPVRCQKELIQRRELDWYQIKGSALFMYSENLHRSHESPVFWLVSLFFCLVRFAVTQSYLDSPRIWICRTSSWGSQKEILIVWYTGNWETPKISPGWPVDSPFVSNFCWFTLLETNMTLENPHFYYRKYIIKWWIFHCHVSLWGGKSLRSTESPWKLPVFFAQVWICLLGCC